MFHPFRFTRVVLLSAAPIAAVAQNAGVPPQIVGTWSSSEVRSIHFKDRATSAFSRPSGAIITYRISADGSYKEDTVIQTSLYNCSDEVFATESGTVHVEDGSLVFDSTRGKLTSQDSCNARFNYTKQLAPRQRAFPRGQSGPELCMADGKNHLCYRRKE
jgi:hypothetical protein